MLSLSERMLSPDAGFIEDYADEVAQLEAALDERLRQEYMDEDHRQGGIGVTYEQFKEDALKEGG